VSVPENFSTLSLMSEERTINEHIRSKFDEWIYTLKNSVVKKEFSAAGLQEASEKLDKLKMSKEELAAYEKFLIDKQCIDSAFRTTRADAFAEGKLIGKAEGKVEEKLEIAKVLKSKGIDVSIISESTGLSEEEIRCL